MSYRNRALLDLAHDLHTCPICGKTVPEGLEPMHSPFLRHGKGIGHKGSDVFAAAGCNACHYAIDNGVTMSREEKQNAWQHAFEATLSEYFKRGWLVVSTDRK